MTQTLRPAAVAGLFYPGIAGVLAADVQHMLSQAVPPRLLPKALVVPHAGYVYSGPVAASAYASLSEERRIIRRVLLLGPAHRLPFHGLAASSATAFETPLGQVPLDGEMLDRIRHLPQVCINDAAHAQEHSLEVQLPFLQSVLEDFSLLPLVVGAATSEQVAEVLDLLWGGADTLVIISSDLSHYHPYGEARRIDKATVDDLLKLTPLQSHQQACGATPLNGLLAVARARGLQAVLLDLRNSGDTAGDKGRVVGYGALAFCAPPGGRQ